MNHLYEDKNKIKHLCESNQMHRDVYLVWTKCGKDVRKANESFKSEEEATCELCLWEASTNKCEDGTKIPNERV